jgi:hypothetical protein
MLDDYADKLAQLLSKMTTEQVRQVWRFAQFIYEDQEPEGMHASDDPVARYQEFARWCQARGIEPATLDGWGKDARDNTNQATTGD